MCCKNCNKHTGNTFPKILILISKNKINEIIHEIESKYDLESELDIYLQFFTD